MALWTLCKFYPQNGHWALWNITAQALNGTKRLNSNQNTMQHLASTLASARKSQHRTDTQDQTHAGEKHGEIIIREKEEGIGGDERSNKTGAGCRSQDLWLGWGRGIENKLSEHNLWARGLI